jgi:hypothetical protein
MLVLELSAYPKNARDLTFQTFVGIMGADQSSCFVVSVGLAGMWKFVRFPGAEADGYSQAAIVDKASYW